MSLSTPLRLLFAITFLFANAQAVHSAEIEVGDQVVLKTTAKPLASFPPNELFSIFPSGIVQTVAPDHLVIDGTGFARNEVDLPKDAIEFYTQALATNPQSVDALIRRCTAFKIRRKFDDAMKDCDAAITIQPENANLYQIQSFLWGCKEDAEKALASSEKAIELDPQDARGFVCRSLAKAAQNKPDEAEADVTKAIELKPTYVFAYLNRANFYDKQGKAEEAIKDFTTAIRHDYNNYTAYRERALLYQKQYKVVEAKKDAEEAIRLNPSDSLSHVALARSFMMVSEFPQAIKTVTHAIELSPKNGKCFGVRGMIHLVMLNREASHKDLQKSLELNPNDSEFVGQLILLYCLEERYDEALATFDNYLKKFPQDLSVRASRIQLQVDELKQYQAAIEDINIILQDSPKNSSALIARARCYKGLEQWDDAQKEIDAALELDPLSATGRSEEGQLYLHNKEYDKAIEAFDKSISANPFEFAALRGRIDAFAAKKDTVTEALARVKLNGAMKTYCTYLNGQAAKLSVQGAKYHGYSMFNNILKENPDDMTAEMGRGMLLLETKLWARAEKSLSHAIELTPRNATAYMFRAHGRAQSLETIPLAIEDYTKAIKFGADRKLCLQSRQMLHYQQKNFAAMNTDLREIIKRFPEDDDALNSLAWSLATCPDEKFRNGKEAVELALKACEVIEWKEWQVIDTLAAAYAEAGDKENAVKYQKQAMELGGEEAQMPEQQERLKLYEEGKSYHPEPKQKDDKLPLPEKPSLMP